MSCQAAKVSTVALSQPAFARLQGHASRKRAPLRAMRSGQKCASSKGGSAPSIRAIVRTLGITQISQHLYSRTRLSAAVWMTSGGLNHDITRRHPGAVRCAKCGEMGSIRTEADLSHTMGVRNTLPSSTICGRTKCTLQSQTSRAVSGENQDVTSQLQSILLDVVRHMFPNRYRFSIVFRMVLNIHTKH